MAKNTVKIKSYLSIHDELTAAGAITPGHLIYRTSANKVAVHATAGGPAQKMFAMEDAYQGRKITDAYNTTTYAHVICWLPTPGDRVYAIFDPTSGGSVALGDFVESAGDGSVRKYTPAASGAILELTNAVIGVALEAQTTPGGRVTIEII